MLFGFFLVIGRFRFGLWTVVSSLYNSTDIAYGRDFEPSFLLSSSRKQIKIVLQAIWYTMKNDLMILKIFERKVRGVHGVDGL